MSLWPREELLFFPVLHPYTTFFYTQPLFLIRSTLKRRLSNTFWFQLVTYWRFSSPIQTHMVVARRTQFRHKNHLVRFSEWLAMLIFKQELRRQGESSASPCTPLHVLARLATSPVQVVDVTSRAVTWCLFLPSRAWKTGPDLKSHLHQSVLTFPWGRTGENTITSSLCKATLCKFVVKPHHLRLRDLAGIIVMSCGE